LIWGLPASGRQRLAPLSPRELQTLWDDLAQNDAPRAYRAMGSFLQAPPQSVPFLQEHVRPIAALENARFQQLLVGLESDQFAVREKATEALEQLGDVAEPALRGVLAGKPSLDVAQRVDDLLSKMSSWSGERLRMWRVIQVLEGIGTLEAQAVLKTLAGGASASRVTQEAKAALERLDKRAGP
jgi:hypothetical protein